MVSLDKRLLAFSALGFYIKSQLKKPSDEFKEVLQKAYVENTWFTEDNVKHALSSIASYLSERELKAWLSSYKIPDSEQLKSKVIAVISAGNIPLAGFHDMLCVIMSGNTYIGKLSSSDTILLPYLVEILIEFEPDIEPHISFVKEEKLQGFDAVIATGSNNTSRYFEHYFSKYPHIIRKNRNSVAVIRPDDTLETLKPLADDVFTYFGMGCRNVSKLFVPVDFSLDTVFEAFFHKGDIISHNKYANNYNYNRTIYLMSGGPFFDNNFVMLKEDIGLSSPIAVVFFERYENEEKLNERLEMDKDHIQCITGKGFIPFGSAQTPSLSDYADGVDTVKFLLSLS